MRDLLRFVCGCLVFSGALALLPSQLHAQTETFGANLGTLSYGAESVTKGCVNANNQEQTYTIWYYTGFGYTTPQNATVSISGSTDYFNVPYPGGGRCPADGMNGGDVTYNVSAYSIDITPGCCGNVFGTITTSGYVNPKYTVLGVTYAPPGPSSYVDYTSSTLVSNTSTLSNSFTQTNAFSVSTSIGVGIAGFAGGKQTNTATSSYSQGENTSTTVSVSKTSSVSDRTGGPPCAYVGVDHDYDLIFVWMNPLHLFTITAYTDGYYNIQWNGYGYSTVDPAAPIDWLPINAGYLNGTYSMPTSYAKSLGRGWAGSEIWPSGQGSGLTSTDEATLLAADPYGHCTYKSAVGSSDCPSPSSTRYTLTTNADVLYEQTLQSFTQEFDYANTSSLGQSVSQNSSQTFGLESAYSTSTSIFGVGITSTVTAAQTEKWTNEWNHKFNSSTTSEATASITSPPCNLLNGACDPVYPPSNAYDPATCTAITNLPRAYGQGTEFDLYQDNLYGSFLLVPVAY